MVKTPIALYRQGNATSPRMDNVRLNKDIVTYEKDGETWVRATLEDGQSSGGISTRANQGIGKNWWKLEASSEIPQELKLVNDRPNHWSWQPSREMPLEEYKAALTKVGMSMVKVD